MTKTIAGAIRPALAFLAGAVMAPSRGPRLALLAATAIEASSFASALAVSLRAASR